MMMAGKGGKLRHQKVLVEISHRREHLNGAGQSDRYPGPGDRHVELLADPVPRGVHERPARKHG
jgi:hypothetical protein